MCTTCIKCAAFAIPPIMENILETQSTILSLGFFTYFGLSKDFIKTSSLQPMSQKNASSSEGAGNANPKLGVKLL